MREEMELHIAEAAAELRRKGLSESDARSEARRRFGSVLRNSEDAHAVWALVWLEQLLQDIRYGIRQLVRARGWSVVAVLTLALGIGASTALFSVIDAAMLRPLPYPDPDRLVTIRTEVDFPDGSVSQPMPSMDDMRTWQNADDVLSSVAGWGGAFGGRIVDGPEPERIQVFEFTEDYLSMHGVTPVLGRDFSFEDMRAEAPPVALLGYGYWQSRYGGRTDAIGESIRLSDGVATIVGVLPRSFNTGSPVSRPLRIPLEEVSSRGTGRVSVYGRLQPGITIEAASERLSSLTVPGRALEARAIVDSRLNRTTDSYRTTVNVLVAAVALILLIACVNVAGLLFARGAARQPEFATRFSVGAGWPRLTRQLLTESLVLALVGAGVGVGLASVALDAIVANIPMSIPENSAVEINLRVLAGTAALLIPTVVVFGFMPAILLSRVNLAQAFAHGARHSVSSTLSRRGGQMLIVAEVALAAILVVGAGLMVRTYARLAAFDLGFDPDGLVAMEVLPLSPDPGVHETYYPELLRRLRATVGIATAGGVDNFPLGGSHEVWLGSRLAANRPGPRCSVCCRATSRRLTLNFSTGGCRRTGTMHPDTGVRLSIRRRLGEIFPDGRAVGGRFTHFGQSEPWTVLGVVADVRHGGPLGDTRVTNSQVYLPFEASEANMTRAMTIVVRPSGSGPNPLGQLRSVAQSVGPRVLVESVRTADDWFGDRVATPRRRTLSVGSARRPGSCTDPGRRVWHHGLRGGAPHGGNRRADSLWRHTPPGRMDDREGLRCAHRGRYASGSRRGGRGRAHHPVFSFRDGTNRSSDFRGGGLDAGGGRLPGRSDSGVPRGTRRPDPNVTGLLTRRVAMRHLPPTTVLRPGALRREEWELFPGCRA